MGLLDVMSSRFIFIVVLYSVTVALKVRRNSSESPCRWLWRDGIYISIFRPDYRSDSKLHQKLIFNKMPVITHTLAPEYVLLFCPHQQEDDRFLQELLILDRNCIAKTRISGSFALYALKKWFLIVSGKRAICCLHKTKS